MFEHSQQCSSLAASLSSALRSNSDTLTCCPRNTAPVSRGIGRNVNFSGLVVEADRNKVAHPIPSGFPIDLPNLRSP